MQKSEHLPIGHRLGGHYEIVNVLGRDDFEIVYLVKDIHRMDNLVLKELFLKNSSFRDKENIYTQEKLKKEFQETKEGIIHEVTLLKEIKEANTIQTYGYFEENKTIYTIMEYQQKAPLESYLKIIPQKIVEPTNKKPDQKKIENQQTDNQKPKSSLFLKLLIALILILIALGAYAYKMVVYDKEKAKEIPKVAVTEVPKTIYHPPLTDRNQTAKEQTTKEIEEPIKEEPLEELEEQKPVKKEPIVESQNLPLPIDVPNDEIETEELPEEPVLQELPSVEVEKQPTVEEPFSTLETTTKPPLISLGTRIGGAPMNTTSPTFTRENIQNFLENFIASGERGSVQEVVNHYDTSVDKYFSRSNVTHQTIYNDKVNYNQKWQQRKFQLLDFQILKTYYKNNVEYCDVKNRASWTVSTKEFQTASGISNVLMTIKKTPHGFKVKSINSF